MAESLSSWLQAARDILAKRCPEDFESRLCPHDRECGCRERNLWAMYLTDLTYAVSVIEAAQSTIIAAESLQESCHHPDCQGEVTGKYRCDERCHWVKFEQALTTWHRVAGEKDG